MIFHEGSKFVALCGWHVAGSLHAEDKVWADVELVERDGTLRSVRANILLDVVQTDALDVVDIHLGGRDVQLRWLAGIHFADLGILQTFWRVKLTRANKDKRYYLQSSSWARR